jgi:hypothetical protein
MWWIRLVKTCSGFALACAVMCRSCGVMRSGLWVPVIVPPDTSLSPASPSLQWVPWVSVPHLLGFSCSLPSVLCSAKTTVAPSRIASHARSRPDTLYPPCVLRPSGRCRRCAVPARRLALLVLRRASPVSAQGDHGPLEFPGYPCAYMPRSRTPVVSPRLAFASPGLVAFRRSQTVGFPGSHRLSSRTTTMTFSGLYHAACTLATPGFTHPLTGYACRFATESAAHLLWRESHGFPCSPAGQH